MDKTVPNWRHGMAGGSGEDRKKSRESSGGATTAGHARGMEKAETCVKCLAYGNFCSAGCREWETYGEGA